MEVSSSLRIYTISVYFFQNRDAASTEECTAYIYLLNISDLCKRDETFVDIRLAMSGATLTAIIQIGRSLRFVLSGGSDVSHLTR